MIGPQTKYWKLFIVYTLHSDSNSTFPGFFTIKNKQSSGTSREQWCLNKSFCPFPKLIFFSYKDKIGGTIILSSMLLYMYPWTEPDQILLNLLLFSPRNFSNRKWKANQTNKLGQLKNTYGLDIHRRWFFFGVLLYGVWTSVLLDRLVSMI